MQSHHNVGSTHRETKEQRHTQGKYTQLLHPIISFRLLPGLGSKELEVDLLR